MKDKEEFLKQMENLQVPEINPGEHHKMVKIAIMNAERSAALGVWLIIAPGFFLLCVMMYYYFHVHIGWFGAMFTLITKLDSTPGIDFLAPIVLVVLPIVCIIINMLSIIHVQYQRIDPDRARVREFSITIKIKVWNILLIVISLVILFAFLAFAMTENISVR